LTSVVFPRRRDDGSFTIRVRFSSLECAGVVRDVVASWIDRKIHQDDVDLLRDFSRFPHVEVARSAQVDVVFDGRADSRMWKDWMVQLTAELRSRPGLSSSFVGFWDDEAGSFHPGHVPSQEDWGTSDSS
jgi:hypothetical protein